MDLARLPPSGLPLPSLRHGPGADVAGGGGGADAGACLLGPRSGSCFVADAVLRLVYGNRGRGPYVDCVSRDGPLPPLVVLHFWQGIPKVLPPENSWCTLCDNRFARSLPPHTLG